MRAVSYALLSWVLFNGTAIAQTKMPTAQVCGPPVENVSTTEKVNLDAKAQTLFRVGLVDLQGVAEKTKNEIMIGANRSDAARLLLYLKRVSCVLIYEDNALSTDEKLKRMEALASSLKLSGNNYPENPNFSVLNKGGDLFLENAGSAANNIEVSYVAMAWLFPYKRQKSPECKSGETVYTEGMAINRGKTSEGYIASHYEVAGIRRTIVDISRFLRSTNDVICNYILQYSVALSYEGSTGLRHNRYYQITWQTTWGPENFFCHKISQDDFFKATQSYDRAKEMGKSWSFNGSNNEARLTKLVDVLSHRKLTELRVFRTSEDPDFDIDALLFPNGHPTPSPCNG